MNESEIFKEVSELCGHAIRCLAPRFGVDSIPNRRERERHLMAEYAEHREATDLAILDWLKRGFFDGPIREEALRCAFFRVAGIEFLYRADVAASVLRSLPPENQTAKGLLRYLLVDYWSPESSWPERWLRDFDMGKPREEHEEYDEEES